MRRIADALREVVRGNPLLQFGLQNRLLNLRRTAEYLLPLLKASTRKSITVGSLTMALSRMQKDERTFGRQRARYYFDRMSLHTGLATFTFGKSKETHAGVQRLYALLQKGGRYITIAEGTGQITLIIDAEYAARVPLLLKQRPLYTHTGVASVSVIFDERYLHIPGLIFIVLQQLMLLNINIIEVSSTFTELSIYVDEKNVRLAFEALENLFYRRRIIGGGK
jgi:hypothetical protein